ncbi:TIGR04222 domain-containing membrane protein [Amycolatopsis tolypomycina]|uniref:TIGR04222 domain-containing membrane protein n=1 Tax=Amycolatopsis tolypomycina TaxID=208445 RepID=UPI0033AC7B46
MTDTWGIPGPVFAGLYLGLLLVPALAAGLRLGVLRRGRSGGVPERAEELALLTGGRTRVGEVVVAHLLEQQTIRMDGTGRVHHVRGSAPDDLGRTVLVRIGKTGTAVESVRREVLQHPEVAALEAGLIARGLLVDVRKVRLTWVFTVLAYVALLVLGAVRLVAGSAAGHPVGFLVGLLVLNIGAAAVGTYCAVTLPGLGTTTTAGRAAATEAERAGPLASGAVAAVAAGGFGSHPDKDVRLAVSRATHVSPSRGHGPRRGWAAASGGSAGFYGGASCGGGGGGSSCGGGGGGGGGGCGG